VKNGRIKADNVSADEGSYASKRPTNQWLSNNKDQETRQLQEEGRSGFENQHHTDEDSQERKNIVPRLLAIAAREFSNDSPPCSPNMPEKATRTRNPS